PAPSARGLSGLAPFVSRLRQLALRGLGRMYRPEEGLFAFRIRRRRYDLVLEGTSPRYTAITLIGLAGEDEATQRSILTGIDAREACASLVHRAPGMDNLGDVALTLWAASAAGYPDRKRVVERLLALQPNEAPHPTVEVAWTLAAVCADLDASVGSLRA